MPSGCNRLQMQPDEGPGGSDMTELPPLDSAVLPSGVRVRFVDGVNDLRMHPAKRPARPLDPSKEIPYMRPIRLRP
jgi:hypothetical protein